jgi:hypothetical protein
MKDMRSVYTNLKPFGRSRHRWEDIIKSCLREIGSEVCGLSSPVQVTGP